MRNHKLTFDNDAGVSLSGILSVPSGPARACALFAHCFTCGKHVRAASHIARSLVDAGIAVLRFDFTGLGQSGGDFADTTFSSNVSDLVAAARYLDAEHAAPALLIGHSLGGTAVLAAAPEIPSARAIATIGAPSEPGHVRHLLAEGKDEIERRGEAEIDLGGRPFRIRREFLEDLDRHDLPGSVGGLRRALLIMHAPLDAIVGIDNASALFGAAKHPKSFMSLDEADHLLSQEQHARYAGRALAAWASAYLPAASPDVPLAADGDEVVAKTGRDGYRTDVSAAGYRLVADEPAAVGGSGLGPTPYDLLAAALATCTSMTLRMYADRKQLDLESATVRIAHGKVHAKDCADCESAEGRIDVFRRALSFEGSLTDAERQRLVEIADRCPVHRTLHGEVKVRTALED